MLALGGSNRKGVKRWTRGQQMTVERALAFFAIKLTVLIRECCDHVIAKLERLMTRWFHPSGSGGTLRVLPNIDQDRHDEQSLDSIHAVSRSTLRGINAWHRRMRDVQEGIGTVRSNRGSGFHATLHAPAHSTLHVGISLLRLMQPIPLEERNRHNVPAHRRQQPITQAAVA